MILAGIKLTLVGMTVVFLFLLLIILTVNISFRMLAKYSAKELEALQATDLRRQRRFSLPGNDSHLIVVISAALAAHRRRSA